MNVRSLLLILTIFAFPLTAGNSNTSAFTISTSAKQTKYYRCTKCGRYHKEEPVKCEGCGNTQFFVVYQ